MACFFLPCRFISPFLRSNCQFSCMTQSFEQRVAARLGLSAKSVTATIELLNGGATVPFIARYRKEATASADRGPLDEVQIGQIKDTYQKLQDLDKRREAILKSIDEQGKLTPELRRKLEATDSLTDLGRPVSTV
jgi:uncharacterized protein